MTLRIDTISGEHETVIRLIGTLRREHLSLIMKQIQSSAGEITIDLGELALIGGEGVRFLNSCVAKGISVANASSYVTDWMRLERTATNDDLC